MDLKTSIEKARSLIENSKNPIMFFDTDTDGSCSFLQLISTFPQLKEGYPISKDNDSQVEALGKIYENHDLIIFFDTPFVIDEFFEVIGNRDVLWCDHHIASNQKILKENKNIFSLNPMDFKKADSRCASYWAYRIADNPKNLVWVVMASVADFYLLDVIKELYMIDEKTFNVLFKIDKKKRDELFEFLDTFKFDDTSVNEQRIYWIQFLTYECGLILYKTFFDILFKFEKFEKIQRILKGIGKQDLIDFKAELVHGKAGIYEKFHEIMAQYKEVYKKVSKVKDSDLILISHHDKLVSFNRQLSEELAFRRDNWKVIFSAYTKIKMDFYSCSFRGNDFDVNSLITTCLKGLKGQGGGHKLAAGAIVSKQDFDIFKSRVEEYFN